MWDWSCSAGKTKWAMDNSVTLKPKFKNEQCADFIKRKCPIAESYSSTLSSICNSSQKFSGQEKKKKKKKKKKC